ncbi:RHS repeat-associated core domain-containing protein [Puniceicoccus vermicola]|uniref:Teneurin-like YD-shell domain-containing protein n=2 Tax=Puniceicoccus vermicola TaxID=388746 RepID=A0A7X1AX97_9BACT|nr:RHS repeat-associated core domain-containing protein [Puniceicoccus vermicola]MBC2601604.1 hypothetical protein [Puniceicoccus vermicola]
MSSRTNGVELTHENAVGETSRLEIDFRSGESTLVRPDGSAVTRVYYGRSNGAASGKIQRIDSPGGIALVQVKYNEFGDVLAVKRAGRATELFQYDERGRLTARQRVGAEPTFWEYKGDSRQPIRVTNPLGDSVRFDYNQNGDLVDMVDLRGERHGFRYDAFGRMIRHDFPMGYSRNISYDEWGRVVGLQNLDGERTDITFADNARVATVAKGDREWVYEYSPQGRLSRVSLNGERILDRSAEELADGDWRLVFRDMHGAETIRQVSPEGYLRSEEDALGNQIAYDYDPVGRLVGWTDPRGGEVRFDRDALGRVTGTENSVGQRERREFDADGNLVFRNNGEQKIAYEYGENGFLSAIDYGGDEKTAYEYDEFGRVSKAASGGVTTRYAYDGLSRLTAKLTALPDGSAHTVLYDYNAAGQKTSVRYLRTDPGAEMVTPVRSTAYRYDALGRMTLVEIDERPGVLYEYDPGTLRLARKHMASGETLAYQYDDEGRTTVMEVTDSEGELVGRIGYEWSSDGRLALRIREGYAAGADDAAAPMLASMKTAVPEKKEWFRIVQDYKYDPLGRLVAVKSADRPELDETYVYDASGNIIEKTIAGVRSQFDYDLANQLKVSHIGTETTRYRYDNAGRLVAELDGHDPVAEYRYGYRDRVMELVRNDTAVKYHYGADGMVAGKQRTSADNRVQIAQAGFGFFSSGSASGRHDYSDSAIEPWVWEDAFGAGGAPQGAKALLAKGSESFSNEPHISGGVPVAGSDRVSEDEKFFVSDYLGNTMMELPGKESTDFGKGRRDTAGFSFLTTAMGANVEEDVSTGADAPVMNRFTGKPYDEDLQAYVFPFRNYSAKLARWTSADPAGFPDGPNRHFYAPVPTAGLDPMGLEMILVRTESPNPFLLGDWVVGQEVAHGGSPGGGPGPGLPEYYSQTRHKRVYAGYHNTGKIKVGDTGSTLSVTLNSGWSNAQHYEFTAAAEYGGGSVSWGYGGTDESSISLGSAESRTPDEDNQWWQAEVVIGRINIITQTRTRNANDEEWGDWGETNTVVSNKLFGGVVELEWKLLEL